MIRRFSCLLIVLFALVAGACASSHPPRPELTPQRPPEPQATQPVQLNPEFNWFNWVRNGTPYDIFVRLIREEFKNLPQDDPRRTVWETPFNRGQRLWVPKVLAGMTLEGSIAIPRTNREHSQGTVQRVQIWLDVEADGWVIKCGPDGDRFNSYC